MVGVARVLLEKTSDAVLVVHVDTACVVLWNPAAEALFGYSGEEAYGMPIELLIPESIRPYHVAGFRRFQETDQADTFSAKHPSKLTILTKQGEEIRVYGTLSRVEGAPVRYVMTTFRRRL